MKKIFIGIFIFSLVLSTTNAEKKSSNENPQKTEGFNFSIEPTFGARVGKEKEIVWQESITGERYKLSELEWEYMPVFYVGSNFLAGYKRFEMSLLSKFFLPRKCGTMKDSDWLQDLYYKTGNTSTKTNYSESDNKLENGIDLEFVLAFKFYPASFLTLRPKLSVNYQQMNFTANNIEYSYGKPLPGHQNNEYFYSSDDIFNTTRGSENINNVMKYRTHNFYLWTGLQADIIPTQKFVISIATEIAPIYYTVAFDNHILRQIEYWQKSLSAFYALRQSFSTTYNFNKFISVSLNFSGVITGESIGFMYYKNSSTFNKYSDGGDAGAATMYIDSGISTKFHW